MGALCQDRLPAALVPGIVAGGHGAGCAVALMPTQRRVSGWWGLIGLREGGADQPSRGWSRSAGNRIVEHSPTRCAAAAARRGRQMQFARCWQPQTAVCSA